MTEVVITPSAPGLEVVRCGPGTRINEHPSDADGYEIVVDPGSALDLRLEVELGTAVGYWHPAVGAERTLPADWAGRTSTSLVSGAPVGCLHDGAGNNLFGWALDVLVDELEIGYGVSEEHKTFALDITGRPAQDEQRLALTIITEPLALATVVGRLASWLAQRLDAPALPVPPVARRPVYSTWYTFTQDLDQDVLDSEAVLAAELGCGSVFVDDGWQRFAVGRGYAGCGDWVPDTDKFPDLAAFSVRARDRGLGVVLWVAPLLLGAKSEVFDRLARFAPRQVEHLRCHVLDPRHREVREHLADTCRRLVVDYDLDGLKIDFLDEAMVYRGTASSGDIADVGEAMRTLLATIRSELTAAGRGDVAVEFRQPYVNPAIAAYGQILRAADCPADAVVNRRSTVDARLLAVGQVVHGDMLMWGPTGGVEAVAQQLYGSWFAVPQISMLLADLSPEQSAALSGLLAWWQQLAPVLLDGSLSAQGSERGYDLVRAARRDLGRAVIGRYAPVVVDLDDAGEVVIVNATAETTVPVRVADGLVITGGRVLSATAAVIADLGPRPTGLQDLAVPPFGSLTLAVDPA